MSIIRHGPKICILHSIFIIFPVVVCGASAAALQVGVAEVDITPPVGFRTGGGYGEAISTGVDDPLLAKALVLRQGEVAAAIVISDLLSVPPDLSGRARQLASETTGIPAANIIVAATHNHGSPEYWGPLRDIHHEDDIRNEGHDPHELIDYQAQLVSAWAKAIETANSRLQPVACELVIAQQHGLAFNRRFHMRDGTVRFNPGRGNPGIIRTAGPVDTDLPILLFRETNNHNQPVASLTTFAMHTAVHGGTTFSGDFPAVLERELRSKLGSNFVSLFAEGTAGDINHIDVSNPDQLRGRPEVERIGQALSGTVLNELSNAKPLKSIELAVVTRTEQAPFQPVSEARYSKAVSQLRNQRRHSFLTGVAAWRDCHRWRYTNKYSSGKKPLEVQAVRLNADTAIVTLPHEVFVEIGLAIKATSPFRNTIVISLAGDIDYYIPTRRAFEEGSYEVTTCPLDPGCGEVLLDTARSALNELKQQ